MMNYNAVIYNGDIYCHKCSGGFDADEKTEILADSVWPQYPTCCVCGELIDYVILDEEEVPIGIQFLTHKVLGSRVGVVGTSNFRGQNEEPLLGMDTIPKGRGRTTRGKPGPSCGRGEKQGIEADV